MNQVLEWVKPNIPIIVLAVVIVAAPIVFWIISSGMNESVQEEIQTRSRGFSELQQIENVPMTRPDTGERITGVPNPQFLEQLKAYTEQRIEDQRRVLDAVIEHNRKGHTIVMPDMFPAPPSGTAELAPRRFHEHLADAYYDLIADVRVGAPPSQSQIAQEMARREQQFRMQVLLRGPDESLNTEEREQLEEELRSLRMLRYEEHAASLMFYMDRRLLEVPQYDPAASYPLDDLFDMQWIFWVHSDILSALYSANEADGSVVHGPVKRVVDLRVGERQSPGGTPQPINPASAVGTDFARSLTGRSSNHLYDVRTVDLRLVVDSNRVFDVIDAISAYNFMTVLEFHYRTADPYRAARSGYVYGPDPVVELDLKVETIWFRDWTSQWMPDETLQALRIQVNRGRADS